MHQETDCRVHTTPIMHVSNLIRLYQADLNSVIISALDAKRGILNDLPASKATAQPGLGLPFGMQTPSQPTANSLPPTTPVSTLDGRRDLSTAFPVHAASTASQIQQRATLPQLPHVNADMQRGDSRQMSSSAASGLSDKSNASKTASLGASKNSSDSQRSLALDGVSATQVGN